MSECMLKNFTDKELEDFKKGQICMTEMLRELDRICRKHNIRYWCVGGTFIGAVRHNGWIPWDADLDVAIYEEDYSRLKDVIESELKGKRMWFQDKTTDKYYNSHFAKIRYLDAYYKDDKVQLHSGLQLDLFIFQKKTNNRIYGESEHFGQKGHDTSYAYDEIFPLREIRFEDITVFVPNKYEDKCRRVFGGYPIPMPPKDKQYPHEGRISFDIPEWMIKKYNHLYV